MSKNSDAAVAMFSEGYNCAQAVFASCASKYGLPRETAVKVAQAFGGGMGRTGNTCGAVTGALMVIGFKRSVANGADSKAKQDGHRLAREFFARFKARNGYIDCRDLLGCDIGTDEGFRKIHDGGLSKTLCPKFIKDAAEIIDEILNSFTEEGTTK